MPLAQTTRSGSSSLLPPGSYTLSAAKEGFKTLTRSGVNLEVDERARRITLVDKPEIGHLEHLAEVLKSHGHNRID